MCVICVKKQGVLFPEEKILRNCWDNNPDMGGFMYTHEGQVHIRKGYLTFEDFNRALNRAREVTGDDAPYVLHFRISTQGYDRECCQPFPLSEKMHNLKRAKVKANMGVAHNGVLDLTSDGSNDYSDTMKFITDYLVNIIRGYDFYKDERTKKLIENLIDGSRFSVLDKNGHVSLFGKGWVEDEKTGCFFSNSSYAREPYAKYWRGSASWDSYYDDWEDPWFLSVGRAGTKQEACERGCSKQGSDLKYGLCPHSLYDDDSYCSKELCSDYHTCPYVKSCKETSSEIEKAWAKIKGGFPTISGEITA